MLETRLRTRLAKPSLLREPAQQLRVDAVRAIASAGSGHPTSSLSAADLVATPASTSSGRPEELLGWAGIARTARALVEGTAAHARRAA